MNFTNVNYHRLYPAQIGGNLDTKGYGIATRPGSGFKDLLDQASTFLDGCVPTNENEWCFERPGAAANAREWGFAPVESEMVEAEERRRPLPKISRQECRGENPFSPHHCTNALSNEIKAIKS